MGSGLIIIFTVNIVIWTGIVLYLFHIDRKIGKLERKIEKTSREN
ncbi:CcmD family protein [candidate division KSB1 bacterium]|nr:CcmD family protein [candidate division KSB1 bacterium]